MKSLYELVRLSLSVVSKWIANIRQMVFIAMGIGGRIAINCTHARRRITFVEKTGGLCELWVQGSVFVEVIILLTLRRRIPGLGQNTSERPFARSAIVEGRGLRNNNIRIGGVTLSFPDSFNLAEWT
jgi:hypothetical protein